MKIRMRLITALAMFAFGYAAQSATITWTNIAGGNWSAATNWSPNQVPGAGDASVITNAGTYAVTLDIGSVIGNLTLGGRIGQQTLSTGGTNLAVNGAGVVNTNGVLGLAGGVLTGSGLTVYGQMNWTGGRIATGSILTVATNGLLTVSGSSGNLDFSGILTNAGTIQLVSAGIRLIDASRYGGGIGELVNLPGGLVDVQSDVTIDYYNDGSGSGSPGIVNQGRLRKSGGSLSYINAPLHNTGMLDAQTGIMNLTANYSLTGGTLNFGINSLTNYGQISLGGSPATLDGSLSANLNNGYVPGTGSSFAVVNYSSQAGAFTNFNLPFPAAWQTNYGASSFTLTVLNVRPTLAAITNQTVDELLPLSVNAIATDPDVGQSLTFALVSNPPGMTIKPISGIINWTPAQTQSPSTNTVLVSVTDNGTPSLGITNSFSVVVKEVNVAPSLPTVSTQSVNELTLLTVPNTATNFNIHSSNTSYALINPPSGMVISTNGIITWTPAQTQSPSTNLITTIVTNSNPYDLVNPRLASTNQFTVIVKEVNVPPSLPTIPTQTVNELTLLFVANAATNANIHSTITGYGLINPPANMVVANSKAGAFITWTPTQSQSPSTNLITTIVTNSNPYDLVNPRLTSTNQFTVIVKEVNVAPSLPTIPMQAVNELQLLTVTNAATNSNIHSTIIGYTLVNLPTNIVIRPSGIITWVPLQTQSPSTNFITTIVTNSNPYDLVNPILTSTNQFTVFVKEVNFPATLPSISTQTVNELTLLAVPNIATNFNIHSTNFGYGLINPPTNMVISSGGVITWTPAQAQSPSTNLVKAIVTNSNPYDLVNPFLTATNSFTVIVKEVNVAPLLPVIPAQTVNAQALLTVTNTALESNIHATVGYALVSPPAGAGISANGIITWTPIRSQGPGTNVITTVVTNTDSFDTVTPHLSATNSFTVIVYAPTLAAIGNYTVNAGQTITFIASATDNDPTRTLTYSLANPPGGAAINGESGVFGWRVPVSYAGITTNLQVSVTDNSTPSLSDGKSFTVTVNPLAPVVLTSIGYSNGQFMLQVGGPAGPDYIISASTNLTQWGDVLTNLAPAPPFQFADTNAPSANRFYRARLSP